LVKTYRLRIILFSIVYFIVGSTFNFINIVHRAHRYKQFSSLLCTILFAFVTSTAYYAILNFLSKTIIKFEFSGQSIKANRYRRLRRLMVLSMFLFVLQGLVFLSEIFDKEYFFLNWKKAWLTEIAFPNLLYLISLFFILYMIRPRKRTITEIEESLLLDHTTDELSLSFQSQQEHHYTNFSQTPEAEIAWAVPSAKKPTCLESFSDSTDKVSSKAD
jgi:hypothetical protein